MDMLPYDIHTVQKYIDYDHEWTKSPDARKMVHLIQDTPSASISAIDMRQYMQTRVASSRHSSAAPVDHLMQQASAQRVISSLLTFPLTLSYGLSLLFRIPGLPPQVLHSDDAPQFKRNVLIVGARSESSLPHAWWRELLYSHHSAMLKELNIRMIGPGLQQSKRNASHTSTSTCSIKLSDQANEAVSKVLNVTVNSSADSDGKRHEDFNLLHEHPERMELLQWADAFVLFNPGIGNEYLKGYWDPTIRLLLSTRKPILCTAYGMHDLRRDLNCLDAISAEEDDQDLGEPLEFAFPPHENPFKSWKRTIDPKEEGDDGIVTTNFSIYAVQAK